MIFRRFLMVVLLVFALLTIKIAPGSQATQTQDLSSLSDADLKTVIVRLERKPCFGNCPVYTLTIYGDGRVDYVGKAGVKTTGERRGRIETLAVKTLMAQFVQAKFLSLPDYSLEKCSCRRCTDMATVITRISGTGVDHQVKHDYGCACAPKALFELESAIDKAANTDQWTGDVSQAGPFGTTCWG